MFLLAIFIGIYSYIIFFLGILGVLYKQAIIIVSLIYLSVIFFIYRGKIVHFFTFIFKIYRKISLKKRFNQTLVVVLGILILAQVIINFIGTLGPELGFDALWYHLTLPKLYIQDHSIHFIPGGLFYYSVMPKLTEMFYIVALSLGSQHGAKIVHFLFGILTCIVIYKMGEKYMNKKYALLAVAIFYSNLVVAWQSITAYVDLTRTFYETLALFAFLHWVEKKDFSWLVLSSLMMGLAITSKLLATGSVLIFCILMIVVRFKKKYSLSSLMTSIPVYLCICLFIPIPWFLLSYVNTVNPVYPFFTRTYPVEPVAQLNTFSFISDLLKILMRSDDPISPIYIILFPLLILTFGKLKFHFKIISLYLLLAFVVWYITPRTGGGRFILPYFPAMSILAAGILFTLKNRTHSAFLILIIIIISASSIVYRGIANAKYLPVILGIQSKDDFLDKNLNFLFGDFYDTDGLFKKMIKTSDKVLLYGFHNLYYVNFPFVDSSYIKKGDRFTHIAVQNAQLPERFLDWHLVYENKKTFVKLYQKGEREWVY